MNSLLPVTLRLYAAVIPCLFTYPSFPMFIPSSIFSILLPLLVPYLAGLLVWEWYQYRRKGNDYPWQEALLSLGLIAVRRV